MKDLKISLLLLLLSVCWKAQARDISGLRGQQQERKLEKVPQEDEEVVEEVQSTTKPEEVSNKELLNCFSNDLLTQPDTQYTRFDLRACRPNLAGAFIARLGVGEKKSDTDALQELLSCVGGSIGCHVGEVGTTDQNLTAPVDDEEGMVLTEEPDSKQGQATNVTANHPYTDLLDCFSSGLDGVHGSIEFSFNAFNCVSASATTLEGMMTCIGKSIGCQVPPKNEEEDEPADNNPNVIPLQVAPQPELPSGTPRLGNPDDAP